jgi:diaminopimelate epimerase
MQVRFENISCSRTWIMRFHKYQALGNSYLVVETDTPETLSPARVRRLCDRHYGVGSDGILLGGSEPDESFSLRIFNPDGSEAEKSGNGLRIFARYLWDLGRVREAPFNVRTRGGMVRCEVQAGGTQVAVHMGQASFDSATIPVAGPRREVVDEELEVAGQRIRATAVSVGNPHCVVHVDHVDATLAQRWGPRLESHALFPNRTNVQFVQVIDRSRIRIEIWERGAGYTLASGSSSCAAAAASIRLGRCDNDLRVAMPGGDLAIVVDEGFSIQMTGPVDRVAAGLLLRSSFEVSTDGGRIRRLFVRLCNGQIFRIMRMKNVARAVASLAALVFSMTAWQVRAAQKPVAARPVVAVVAQNSGTEPTDFLVPFGLLAGSGAVDAHAVALTAGTVMLHPGGIEVELPHTVATFDANYPEGADYIIVPAVHDSKDKRLAAWLQAQRTRGAVVMGVCDGAKVLAHAGLLAGRSATAHWYSLDDLRKSFPETTWRNDRRYVFDEGVVTTSGVSASVPATFALLEHIIGRTRTSEYAASLGIGSWPAEHDGAAFRLSGKVLRTAAANRLAFWRHERVALVLPQHADEVTAALIMDAYSRTYRSDVVVETQGAGPLMTRHGLVIHPDHRAASRRIDAGLLQLPLGQTLNGVITQLESDYGHGTADFVAVQLEHVRVDTLAPP